MLFWVAHLYGDGETEWLSALCSMRSSRRRHVKMLAAVMQGTAGDGPVVSSHDSRNKGAALAPYPRTGRWGC